MAARYHLSPGNLFRSLTGSCIYRGPIIHDEHEKLQGDVYRSVLGGSAGRASLAAQCEKVQSKSYFLMKGNEVLFLTPQKFGRGDRQHLTPIPWELVSTSKSLLFVC